MDYIPWYYQKGSPPPKYHESINYGGKIWTEDDFPGFFVPVFDKRRLSLEVELKKLRLLQNIGENEEKKSRKISSLRKSSGGMRSIHSLESSVDNSSDKESRDSVFSDGDSTPSSSGSPSAVFDFHRRLSYASHTPDEVFESFRQRKKSENKFLKKDPNNYRCLDITTAFAVKYTLLTVYERRHERVAEAPYSSKFCLTKTPARSATSIWNVKVSVPSDYSTRCIKIPGTSKIITCSDCSGKGYTTCDRCNGQGEHRCYTCSGEGHRSHGHHAYTTDYTTGERTSHYEHSYSTCHHCYGNGMHRCDYCYGEPEMSCSSCNRTGKQEQFKQIVVEWMPRKESVCDDGLEIPEEFLKKCKGDLLETKAGSRKSPLQPFTPAQCPNPGLLHDSRNLLESHMYHHSPGSQIRKQNHALYCIPVYFVEYELRGKAKQAVLAGKDLNFLKTKKYHKRKFSKNSI